MRIAYGLLALLFLAPAQAQQPLGRILKELESGETAIIAAGDQGRLDMRGRRFDPPATVRFEPGAEISGLRLENVRGLVLEGVTVIAGIADLPKTRNAAMIIGGGEIEIADASFEWADDGNPLNDGSALVVDGASNVKLIAGRFRAARNGVHVRDSVNVSIEGSHFSDILADGVKVSGSREVRIVRNTCSAFSQTLAFDPHPDCIQLQTGGRGAANQNVTISHNIARRNGGAPFQGVFVSGKADAPFHERIIIENNLVSQAKGNGIFATRVNGLIIRNNRVLASTSGEPAPRIVVRDPVSDVGIEGNSAAAVNAPMDARMTTNTIIK